MVSFGSSAQSSFYENGRGQLFELIKLKNEKELTDLLKTTNNHWLSRDSENFSTLHHSVYSDSLPIFNLIINETKKILAYDRNSFLEWINGKTKQGFTPLLYASFRGNIQMIKILIDNGANIEAVNTEGLGMIHLAAQNNKPSSIVYFKEHYGLSLTVQDEGGSTPLHWACYSGAEDAFIFLMFLGANLDKQDKEGLTPLHVCVLGERLRIVRKLLHFGANRNLKDKKDRTPLDIAIEKNYTKIEEALKSKPGCKLFNIEVPTEKLQKDSSNFIIFIVMHLIIEFFVLFGLCCKLNSDAYGVMYLILFILILTIFVYIKFSNPGFIVNKSNQLLEIVESSQMNVADYCPKCIIKKDPSTKHCLICDHCVKGFDHHCFWVNNCIGNKNKLLFRVLLVLLVINFLYNIFLAIMSWAYAHNSNNNYFPHHYSGLDWLYNAPLHYIISIVTVLIVLSFMVLIGSIVVLNFKNNKKSNNDHKSLVQSSEKERFLDNRIMTRTTFSEI